MNQDRRQPKLLYALLLVFFVGQAALEKGYIFNAWVKNYAPKGTMLNSSKGIDPQSFLFALAGFREMIAGILWVRADSFFDTGNYDAILPIIRLVTLLDPQEIDVYATGMWHIGYNFTDEEQRSDRRYIPSALALGKEGCRQNPNTYELFFETGWLWYHKIDDDYDHAVDWFTQAGQRADMLPARRNLLGMAYQRDGQPLKGLETYEKLYEEADARSKDANDFASHQNRDTLENNIDTNLVRLVQRGWVAENKAHSLNPIPGYDTYPPFDVGFSVKATVVEGHKIKFEGTWNVLPVGTRIRVVLKDHNFPHDEAAGMKWDFSNDVNLDPPKDETFMQDQLFVKNRRFNHTVDMSKDPTMYPFKSETYDLEFYYNPRSGPPHIQDKFGWNGEGMTDKNFMNTSIRPDGQRCVYWKTTLTKDQILRHGEWADKVPVVKTSNYKETEKSYEKDDTIIQIPSLRGK
jgi:tetratricopeptide (TPR) repeat protein